MCICFGPRCWFSITKSSDSEQWRSQDVLRGARAKKKKVVPCVAPRVDCIPAPPPDSTSDVPIFG